MTDPAVQENAAQTTTESQSERLYALFSTIKNLRGLRTQTELASLLNFDRATIGRILRRQTSILRQNNKENLSQFLSIPEQDIIDYLDSKIPLNQLLRNIISEPVSQSDNLTPFDKSKTALETFYISVLPYLIPIHFDEIFSCVLVEFLKRKGISTEK